MANEFTKGTTVIPAITGKLARASIMNQNLALMGKDSLIGFDADGTPQDTDGGDETVGTNGSIIADLKVRSGKALKIYDASGNLLNSANWANLLTASTYIDKCGIYGLVPSSNSGTPDEQIDITSGKCIAEDGLTILSLASLTIADLTNHITPGASTTYHLFLYRNASSGLDILDFTTSLSPTAGTGDAQLPNLDVGKLRRVGSFKTDGSADLLEFTSTLEGRAIRIEYKLNIQDYNAVVGIATHNLALSMPTGLSLLPIMNTSLESAGNNATIDASVVSNFQTVYSARNLWLTNNNIVSSTNNLAFKTTTGIHRVIVNSSANSPILKIVTAGYIDYRNNF